jgi:hypothetical protein
MANIDKIDAELSTLTTEMLKRRHRIENKLYQSITSATRDMQSTIHSASEMEGQELSLMCTAALA